MTTRPLRDLFRIGATAFRRIARAPWFPLRRPGDGVHAVALTPAGEIVLVKLTYASGWRLPGGGRRAAEPAQAAALRELREEIGLVAHGSVRPVGDPRRPSRALFVVSDVRYRSPRWSLEIEEVAAFAPDRLPPDLAPVARRQIAEAATAIEAVRSDCK